MGPTFTLRVYQMEMIRRDGKTAVGYTLKQHQAGKTTTIFDGSDIGLSPMDAVDSDGAVETVMGFLTLRRGDTDSDYFDNYTSKQLEFSETHAESLGCEVSSRFGQDD